jgi:hypothetical protein
LQVVDVHFGSLRSLWIALGTRLLRRHWQTSAWLLIPAQHGGARSAPLEAYLDTHPLPRLSAQGHESNLKPPMWLSLVALCEETPRRMLPEWWANVMI